MVGLLGYCGQSVENVSLNHLVEASKGVLCVVIEHSSHSQTLPVKHNLNNLAHPEKPPDQKIEARVDFQVCSHYNQLVPMRITILENPVCNQKSPPNARNVVWLLQYLAASQIAMQKYGEVNHNHN